MMKLLRTNAGLTQGQAAQALGVRQSAVAMWESGVNHPSAHRYRAIAALYKVSVEAIIKACYGDEGGENCDTVSKDS